MTPERWWDRVVRSPTHRQGRVQLQSVDASGAISLVCVKDLDLTSDPHNCGAAGNDLTVLPHVLGAVCVNGVGHISCQTGFFDSNGQLADGCESTCAHPNGVAGEVYVDCAPLGTPGTESTYSKTMAQEAAQAYIAASSQSGVGSTLAVDCNAGQTTDQAIVVIALGFASHTWTYKGAAAGHVSTGPAGTPAPCATTADAVWR